MHSQAWGDSDPDSDAEDTSGNMLPFSPRLFSVLIAIDTDKSMFTTSENGKSPFRECIEACHRLTDSLVLVNRTSLKGPLALALAENDEDRAVLSDFDSTILETIGLLKSIKDLPDEELASKYCRKSELDLATFFLYCMRRFSTAGGDLFRKTVVYITNDDDPVRDDAAVRDKFKVMNASYKFATVKTYLHVVTFKRDFDQDRVYTEILSAANSPDVTRVQGATELLEVLEPLIHEKYAKYSMKFYPYRMRYDVCLDLIVHKLVKQTRVLKNGHMTKDTQQEVMKVFVDKYGGDNDDEEQEEEEKVQQKYQWFYDKSRAPIVLDAFETSRLKNLVPNLPIGFHLLHVGDVTSRKGWVIEGASLVDENVEKSNRDEDKPLIFRVLWEFCRDNSKCLICLRKYRKGGRVRYVEFVPRYVDGTCMFLARTFPYGTDIQYGFRPKKVPSFTWDEEKAMADLVNALSIDYNPCDFTHPVVGGRKAYLKSQLLCEPMENVDTGVLSDEKVDELVTEQIRRLKDLGIVDEPPAQTGGKRPAAKKATAAASSKKLKSRN